MMYRDNQPSRRGRWKKFMKNSDILRSNALTNAYLREERELKKKLQTLNTEKRQSLTQMDSEIKVYRKMNQIKAEKWHDDCNLSDISEAGSDNLDVDDMFDNHYSTKEKAVQDLREHNSKTLPCKDNSSFATFTPLGNTRKVFSSSEMSKQLGKHSRKQGDCENLPEPPKMEKFFSRRFQNVPQSFEENKSEGDGRPRSASGKQTQKAKDQHEIVVDYNPRNRNMLFKQADLKTFGYSHNEEGTSGFSHQMGGHQASGLSRMGGHQASGLSHMGGHQACGLSHMGGHQASGLSHMGGHQASGLSHMGGHQASGLSHQIGGHQASGLSHQIGGHQASGLSHMGGHQASGLSHQIGGHQASGLSHQIGGHQASGYSHMSGHQASGLSHQMGGYQASGLSHQMSGHQASGLCHQMGGHQASGLCHQMGGHQASRLSHQMNGHQASGLSHQMGDHQASGLSPHVGGHQASVLSHQIGDQARGLFYQTGSQPTNGTSRGMCNHKLILHIRDLIHTDHHTSGDICGLACHKSGGLTHGIHYQDSQFKSRTNAVSKFRNIIPADQPAGLTPDSLSDSGHVTPYKGLYLKRDPVVSSTSPKQQSNAPHKHHAEWAFQNIPPKHLDISLHNSMLFHPRFHNIVGSMPEENTESIDTDSFHALRNCRYLRIPQPPSSNLGIDCVFDK